MEINERKEFTVKARLLAVNESVFTAKNGRKAEIVTLETDLGRFTAFKTIFKRQNLPIGEMNEGELVEIRFTTYSKGDRVFKNFLSVRRVMESLNGK